MTTGLSGLTTATCDSCQATSRQVVRGCLARCWWGAQGWILAIGVGICTSLAGALIEFGVAHLSSVRFGYCSGNPLASYRGCSDDRWVFWGTGFVGFVANIGLGTCMAFASAFLVYRFAPAASGSGIPEVKTILNGFVMPDVVSLRTLLVKIPGLMLSVAAGMSLGKEGPLVHVAVCIAQQLSSIFPQFQNEAKRREMFSAAAAAGVSTAFGAPLGGVLFSLEEVSSFFPSRTLIRAFTAAMAAAIVLSVLNTNSNTKGLTLFSVEYSTAVHPIEYIGFALLGVAGGVIGAAFNALNVRWSAFRMRPAFRKRVHPLVEVTLIAVVTLLTSWPLRLTRQLSADSIHAMFESCDKGSGKQLRGYFGLCTAEDAYAPASRELLQSLALAALVRLLQTILTFGTACPAGLFVPSLFTGACIGRFMGVVLQAANQGHALFPRDVEPGVYSMVGAAAVLGGVCRVTISLVAIMLELTGGMTYIVPFMIAVLIAKTVGDSLNEGIYDLYIVLKGYPFLQEELDVTFTERCCDIMETGLTKLDVCRRPSPADLRWMLQTYSFRGFPVVSGERFIGYIKRQRLEDLLDRLEGRNCGASDAVRLDELLPFTDVTVLRMVPDASLAQAHKVFKQLGCKYIFLVGSRGAATQDVLHGILSKKNFLRFLKSGRVGHMADHPSSAPRNWAANSATPGDGEGRLRTRSLVTRMLGRSRRQRASSSTSFLAESLRSWGRGRPEALESPEASPEASPEGSEDEEMANGTGRAEDSVHKNGPSDLVLSVTSPTRSGGQGRP
ncbi:unnamed protein product [Polarella glacialis]|uniref:Chloride channel protein n=1 Tax=Polarella glacialis TaxID=89957 RepID=A0A813DNA7_POLGL|nr:unnamed protein product [Polarella glacialis]